MMHTLLVLAAAALNSARALPMPEDTITFNITMNQSTCRHVDAKEVHLCSLEAPISRRLTLTLQEVPADPMEERAFAAQTPSFTMTMPGGDPYVPWAEVRKSVAMNGTSVIYTLRFRVQNAGAQIGDSPMFETVYVMADQLRMSEPLALPADRRTDARGFKQYSFTIMPAVQFANLVRDPE